MNNIVIMDARDWHNLCYTLMLDSYTLRPGGPRTGGRKEAFEAHFNCKVKWKSNLDTWAEDNINDRPEPSMIIIFNNEPDAVLFRLKWT